MESCQKSLKISDEEMKQIQENNKKPKKKLTQAMRVHLREREYKNWCDLKSKGKGVESFKDCKDVNKRIMEKRGLTNTEWIQILKMNGQVAPVRALHGRGQDNRCRHCDEIETLGHVLGFCDRGYLLRNTRHNTVRTLIADEFRRLKWNVYEEVHCINPSRSTQRIDILIYKNEKSYILDPTIRFETVGNQPEEVNLEKKAHYDSVIPYFKDKYKLADIEVIGLFIGARGTISVDFENFRTKFDLSKEMRNNIALSVIKSSVQILQHHTYNL